MFKFFNPLCANFTKWSNTLKQFVGNLPTNCLSVFDHFVGLAFKGLIYLNDKNKITLITLKCLIYIKCLVQTRKNYESHLVHQPCIKNKIFHQGFP